VLGKQLDLFSVDELVGPGFVLWHPKGAIVRTVLEDMIRRELVRRGYQAVFTPHVAREQLLVKSGHMEHYKREPVRGMELDGQRYLVRPMNCPFHIAIYRSQLRSHRELPVRYASWAACTATSARACCTACCACVVYPRRRPPVPARRPDRRGTGGLCALGLDILRVFGFADVKAFLATRRRISWAKRRLGTGLRRHPARAGSRGHALRGG